MGILGSMIKSGIKSTIITQLIAQLDIDKIDEYAKLLFGAKPNGFLGEMPLVVLKTSYTQDNQVTGYKSYLKDSFTENMFIDPYTLEVECILYGLVWEKELELLLSKAKNREYTLFYYTKLNKTYAPVVITGMSYSEDYNDYNTIKVKFGLKEINLLQFSENENGEITTNVYDATAMTQNRELTEVNNSDNLNEKLDLDMRV